VRAEILGSVRIGKWSFRNISNFFGKAWKQVLFWRGLRLLFRDHSASVMDDRVVVRERKRNPFRDRSRLIPSRILPVKLLKPRTDTKIDEIGSTV
jgi:hypothetical protein